MDFEEITEIEKAILQDIASTAGEPTKQLMRKLLLNYDIMKSTIEDIEYQVQQSNHPASLGILSAIKSLK